MRHVVSQNCDGLHFRSGLPADALSEIHGNMFCELCPNCHRRYMRNFDVTERTGLRRHGTGRRCSGCTRPMIRKESAAGRTPVKRKRAVVVESPKKVVEEDSDATELDAETDATELDAETDAIETADEQQDALDGKIEVDEPISGVADEKPAAKMELVEDAEGKDAPFNELVDTIVHFGEKSRFEWPQNWKGAMAALEDCDLLLCLGSSLKVLREYKCLWPARSQRVPLVIVNLQWTPKDKLAELKINARCDDVMRMLMQQLEMPVPAYKPEDDQLLKRFEPLTPAERSTCSRYRLFESCGADAPPLDEKFAPGWFGKGIKPKK